ncbi:MAG: hypothetical protein J5J06_03690 [Phycisphaerae bacterium]|nr:hypothetical protein [Phycisphaerae bacterium]
MFVRLERENATQFRAAKQPAIAFKAAASALLLMLAVASPARSESLTDPLPALPDSQVLMKAMADEMSRSMEHLSLGDLPRPYFLQYTAEDRAGLTLRAEYGAIVSENRERSRSATSRVRVGSFTLDNTNVGGGGQRNNLPLDDDYEAIRHTLWSMTDLDYKQAVEILSRKLAFLRDKTAEDRPDDFTPAEPVQHQDPTARIEFDPETWQANVRTLSGRFLKHPKIQNSGVRFFAGAVNEYVVNSEGTRLRTGDTGVIIEIVASVQADDGMGLADSLNYIGERFDQLPSVDEMLKDIDEMCANLVALADAPVLEQYSGPVLFEPMAAAKAFESLLADEICARPSPLGTRRSSASQAMERKLGLRILPRSFNVYDDPTQKEFDGTLLAGHYEFDDEAVPAEHVSVVEKGMFRNMLASRSPTRKVKGTNGHGRTPGFGDPEARIGCLFIEDTDGLAPEALRDELRTAAAEEGLDFGLRVATTQRGGGRRLGNPMYVYKVNVDDGSEQLVRGMEFQPVQTRSLKRLLAAGSQREVYNSVAGVTTSIVSPAVIFDELDLHKIEGEFDKPPILPSPEMR